MNESIFLSTLDYRNNKTHYLDFAPIGSPEVPLAVPNPVPYANTLSEPDWHQNFSFLNSSELDLVERLGPRRQELYKAIPITIVYCVIFVTGIIGNVATCIVIARNRYMQTATNFYLFNLAIADLLVLILGLPQETYSQWSAYPWIFGETFCVVRVMAAETSTYASILTITAFTVERYVAICHPMKSQTMSILQRAIKVIVILWIVSAVCSIPMVVQFGVVYLPDSHGNPILESATCDIQQDRYLKHAFEISTFLYFFAPMTIITVLYTLIGLAVRRSTLSRTGSDTSTRSEQLTGSELRAQQQARARRSVLKMLVAVVVVFFICWAPFHLQRLMVIYLKKEHLIESPALIVVQNVLYYVSGVFYYFSSVVNPILYNIMSLKFRQAFKSTIFRSCKRRRKRTSYKTYRFHPRPFTDTNMTLIRMHLNGYLAGENRAERHLTGGPKFEGARSSSSMSGCSRCSSPRVVKGKEEQSAEDIELAKVLSDFKSCHSYHHPTPAPSCNHTWRPYHSFA